MSNEAICETVDQIQIAPRLAQATELKERKQQPSTKNAAQSLEMSAKRTALRRKWYQQLFLYRLLRSIHNLLWLRWRVFSVWSVFNYFVECTTCLLCRTFVINNDCDVIYK